MLIDSKGVKTDKYYVPPFNLNSGEIVVIHLFSGSHYYDLKMKLVDIFTGKVKIDSVKIIQPLTFVEHLNEPFLRRLFNPLTVGKYINLNVKQGNTIPEKLYGLNPINSRTKISSLPDNLRKALSLYCTLTSTQDIIFDLDGIDPQSANDIYKIVKENVKNGGSAILLDWTDDLKGDCTKFITVEVNEK